MDWSDLEVLWTVHRIKVDIDARFSGSEVLNSRLCQEYQHDGLYLTDNSKNDGSRCSRIVVDITCGNHIILIISLENIRFDPLGTSSNRSSHH